VRWRTRIGAGQRGVIDVPVTIIVRNSWNAGWGDKGHLRIPFADFQNQFRRPTACCQRPPGRTTHSLSGRAVGSGRLTGAAGASNVRP